MAEIRRVAVVGGNRIPFARSNSTYAKASNQDMLTAALDGLVARYGLAGQRVGEVVAGAVLKHSRDFNLTREAVLGSRLAPDTPANDIQQACDTGIQATINVANKIALGQIEVGIAGGVDTTSDAPLAVNEGLRKILLEANRAKSLQGRLKALVKVRPGHLAPAIPQNSEPRTGMSMGEHAALTALEWSVGRNEQDELAVASHHNLAAAYERGFLDDLVTPYLGLERDQNLRAHAQSGPPQTIDGDDVHPQNDGTQTVERAANERRDAERGVAHRQSHQHQEAREHEAQPAEEPAPPAATRIAQEDAELGRGRSRQHVDERESVHEALLGDPVPFLLELGLHDTHDRGAAV